MKICISMEFSVKLILVSLEHAAIWTNSEVLAISSKVLEEEKFEKNSLWQVHFYLAKPNQH